MRSKKFVVACPFFGVERDKTARHPENAAVQLVEELERAQRDGHSDPSNNGGVKCLVRVYGTDAPVVEVLVRSQRLPKYEGVLVGAYKTKQTGDELMSELKSTNEFCVALRKRKALVYPAVAGRYGTLGWPDRFISHVYWTGWIEFKDSETVYRPGQLDRIKELNERQPGTAFFARFDEGSRENGALYMTKQEEDMGAVCPFVGPDDFLQVAATMKRTELRKLGLFAKKDADEG